MRQTDARTRDLERALEANRGDLLRYFQRRQINGADAAESFGELLLTIWKLRRQMPTEEEQTRMWMFGVAHNVLRNSRRTLARRSAATSRLAAAMNTSPALAPTDDRSLDIQRALEALPRNDAELVRLTYWDGLTSDEASVVLGIKASTARSRLSTARQKLREVLAIDADPC